jgi:hypothetical protein
MLFRLPFTQDVEFTGVPDRRELPVYSKGMNWANQGS